MRACVVFLVLALSACALTLTDEEKDKCLPVEDVETCLVNALESKKEDARYRREDRDTLFREQFYRFAADCRAHGGYVGIRRHTPRYCPRNPCPPDWGDSYWCN